MTLHFEGDCRTLRLPFLQFAAPVAFAAHSLFSSGFDLQVDDPTGRLFGLRLPSVHDLRAASHHSCEARGSGNRVRGVRRHVEAERIDIRQPNGAGFAAHQHQQPMRRAHTGQGASDVECGATIGLNRHPGGPPPFFLPGVLEQKKAPFSPCARRSPTASGTPCASPRSSPTVSSTPPRPRSTSAAATSARVPSAASAAPSTWRSSRACRADPPTVGGAAAAPPLPPILAFFGGSSWLRA